MNWTSSPSTDGIRDGRPGGWVISEMVAAETSVSPVQSTTVLTSMSLQFASSLWCSATTECMLSSPPKSVSAREN